MNYVQNTLLTTTNDSLAKVGLLTFEEETDMNSSVSSYRHNTDDLLTISNKTYHEKPIIWPTVQRQPGYYNEKRRIKTNHERLESSWANDK